MGTGNARKSETVKHALLFLATVIVTLIHYHHPHNLPWSLEHLTLARGVPAFVAPRGPPCRLSQPLYRLC
jgi:hypothetical protein